MKKSIFTSLIALFTFGSTANASTLTFTNSVALAPTDFNATLSIPKFSPSLGTLDSIDFALSGTIVGDVFFENRSQLPATISTTLESMIAVAYPDSTVLTSVIPAITTSDFVTEFDGTSDFGGDSGRSITGLTNTLNGFFTSSDASVIALFTGSGEIVLPVLVTGASSTSGSGNVDEAFNNSASADLDVTYNFTPVSIPESSGILSIGAVVAMLAGAKRCGNLN